MNTVPVSERNPLYDSETRFATETEGNAGEKIATGVAAEVSNQSHPLSHWKRYRIEKLLGQGGMGRVYLAYDPKLRRRVAVKFLHREDLSAAKRFLAEARAQARVVHDRVCQVYEVGETEGKTYIVMQYIQGSPLHRAGLSLEDKVILLKRVAQGLQAAHAAGLVHRDIKPANIMVERHEDGFLKPYLMDFGLAQSHRDHGTTSRGFAGTPQYMSPEQARGETAKLDRRTDIYSLGATLYCLLTGKPPFRGEQTKDVVQSIINEAPTPPRVIAPDIPADLEAICLKCMDKSRSNRYASARELSRDLGRYLEGEPVMARAKGFLYRARKKIQKNRLLASIAALAFLILLIAAVSILNTRRVSRMREQLAGDFTERVERIEARARFSALSPAHDIRPDREKIRRMMHGIERAMAQAGSLAEGPGHYALGRGYLALDEATAARAHLETSWHSGYQRPRVAFMLGIVWGRFYQKHLLAAESIKDPQVREARKREIKTRYLAPAQQWLALGEGAEVPYPTQYGQALLAYYEERFQDAAVLIDDTAEKFPWFHEGPRLEGDIHLALANHARQTGQLESASHHFARGIEAYEQAVNIGESVPGNRVALGELYTIKMRTALYSGGDVQAPFENLLHVVQEALTLDKHHLDSLLLMAAGRRLFAESLSTGQGDAGEILDEAVALALRTQDLGPSTAVSYELGRIYRQRALHLQEKGEDPRPDLESAIQTLARIGQKERTYDYFMNLGLIYKIYGDYLFTHGRDDRPYRDKAIAAYREAVAYDSDLTSALINLGLALFQRTFEGEGSPQARDLEEAAKALNRAIEINPEHLVAHFTLGRVYQRYAKVATTFAEDPLPWLEKGLAASERAHHIKPKNPAPLFAMGSIQQKIAELLWHRGGDPAPRLDQAITYLRASVALGSKNGRLHNNLGEALRIRADFLIRAGANPEPYAGQALAAYGEAAVLLPKMPVPKANLSKTHLSLVRADLRHGVNPEANFQWAEQYLEQAKRLGSEHLAVISASLRFHRQRGRWLAQRGKNPTAEWDEAEKWLDMALQRTPDNSAMHLLSVHLAYHRAAWEKNMDLETIWSMAMNRLNKAIVAGGDEAELMALKGAFYLLRAETADNEQKAVWRDEGKQAFQAAFTLNANLFEIWKNQALVLGMVHPGESDRSNANL